MRTRRRGSWTVPGTVVAIAAVAGMAYAAIPDSAGVIHACYKQNSGSVRIVDAGAQCSGGEVPLAWSQTGPAGPAGQPGQPGVNGVNGLSCWDLDGSGQCDPSEDVDGDEECTALDCQGPPGSAGTVALQAFGNFTPIDTLWPAFTPLFTKTLPAGSYVLFATVSVQVIDDAGPAQASALCQIMVGGAPSATADTGMFAGGAVGDILYTQLPMMVAVTTPADASVELRCAKFGADPGIEVRASQATLIAMPVAAWSPFPP